MLVKSRLEHVSEKERKKNVSRLEHIELQDHVELNKGFFITKYAF